MKSKKKSRYLLQSDGSVLDNRGRRVKRQVWIASYASDPVVVQGRPRVVEEESTVTMDSPRSRQFGYIGTNSVSTHSHT